VAAFESSKAPLFDGFKDEKNTNIKIVFFLGTQRGSSVPFYFFVKSVGVYFTTNRKRHVQPTETSV
jgi:hypothetical protein